MALPKYITSVFFMKKLKDIFEKIYKKIGFNVILIS